MEDINEEKLEQLSQTPLFSGISNKNLQQLLTSLGARQRTYYKGETLLLFGFRTKQMGVVLKGEIEAIKETFSGNSFTVSQMGVGGVFGDVLSGSNSKSPVTVMAKTNCHILLLSHKNLFSKKNQSSPHTRLLLNLVGIISDKYFQMDARINLLLIKSLRKRICSFLLKTISDEKGSLNFCLPHTRTSLANYLGCERSALSREISRMAADGLLQTKGACFNILSEDALKNALAK